jgi:hypothetical protein
MMMKYSLQSFSPRCLFFLACVFSFGSSSVWCQRSSLPLPLRVLYDSFETSTEKIDGGWWLEIPDLIEGTDLPIYASMDEDNDLFIGVLIGQNDIDVQGAYAQTEKCNRWNVMVSDEGGLLFQDWIFKTSEDEILVEFILSVAELSVFLQNLMEDDSADELLFNIAGCLSGIERSLVGLPMDYRSMLNPQLYCTCLAELVSDDPDLLFALLDVTNPKAIQAMSSCWSVYCPDCGSIGVSFEQAMLGLQVNSDAIGEINSIGRTNFVNGCVKEFSEEVFMDVKVNFAQVETSCECIYDKLLRQDGFTLADFQDPNGVIVNEMFDECMSEVFGEYSSFNEGARPRGCTETIRLPLLMDVFSGSWKIKVNLGVSEKYLILDTGASELIIDQDWANELKVQGILSNSPIDQVSFLTAENREVVADIYVASRMSLGGCDFYDFKVAVIPEGGMLCGMGVLSLFSSWQIDEDNRELVLTVD